MGAIPDISTGSVDEPDKKIESIVKQANEAFRQISNESRTSITKDDAGDGRLLVGYQQNGFVNGNVGVKMSQSGYDVESATSDQLIFSTDFNSFKIATSATTQLAVDNPLASGGTNTKTIAHGLSSVPAVLAYLNGTGSTFLTASTYYSMPYQIPVPVAGVYQGGIRFSFYVDATNIVFEVKNFTSVAVSDIGTATFKYYLLKETAT